MREVLIHATPATSRGYSEGSLRNVVTSSGGSVVLSAASVGFQVPSPGSAGRRQRRDPGRAVDDLRPRAAGAGLPAPRSPTRGSARSAGPPFSGAFSE